MQKTLTLSKLSQPLWLLKSKVDFAKNEDIGGYSSVVPGEPRGTLHVDGIASSSVRLTVVKVSVAVFYWCPVQPVKIVGTKQIIGPNPNVTW